MQLEKKQFKEVTKPSFSGLLEYLERQHQDPMRQYPAVQVEKNIRMSSVLSWQLY